MMEQVEISNAAKEVLCLCECFAPEINMKMPENFLLKLKELISQNPKLKEPTFMMVVTATKTAYKTESGVLVVPIGCLKN